MNPVLFIIIVLTMIAVWFLASFLFYPLGKLIKRIIADAKREMNRDKESEEE